MPKIEDMNFPDGYTDKHKKRLFNKVTKALDKFELSLFKKDDIENIYLICCETMLEPDSENNYIYIARENNNLKPIFGYRGLEEIIRRYYKIEVISQVVYKGDEIDIKLGTENIIYHNKKLVGTDRNELIGAYAYADVNGIKKIAVLNKSDLDFYKVNNNNEFWNKYFASMSRKTAVRELMNQLPKDIDFSNILRVDNETTNSGIIEDERTSLKKRHLFQDENIEIPEEKPSKRYTTI